MVCYYACENSAKYIVRFNGSIMPVKYEKMEAQHNNNNNNQYMFLLWIYFRFSNFTAVFTVMGSFKCSIFLEDSYIYQHLLASPL